MKQILQIHRMLKGLNDLSTNNPITLSNRKSNYLDDSMFFEDKDHGIKIISSIQKSTMKKLFTLFICLILSLNSFAVARWVNNQGATRPASVTINSIPVATAPTTYTTIQSAIDAAVSGDYVYITDGEYRNPNEFTSSNCSLFGVVQDMGLYLHLNFKSNITLTSESGDCCGSSARLVGYGFDFHAGSNITVQGLKIDSVRVNAFWNSNCCNHLPTQSVTIKNNYISNTRGHGIKTDGLEDYSRTGWQITGNYFENIGFYNGNGNCLTPAAVSAMWLSNPNTFTIQNNRIINTKWAGILCQGFYGVVISGNRIDKTVDAGIQLGVANPGAYQNGANVNNNKITNANTGQTLHIGAITLYPNNISGISITNNDISNSFNGIAAGIAGWQNSLDTKNINNNNIYNLSPGSFGVTHILQTGTGGTGCACGVQDDLNLYNLTNNYWGSSTGPTYVTNPGGTGVALRKETLPQGGVIHSLNDFGFTPYLTSPATVTSITNAEINLQGNSTDISDGDNTPSVTDNTQFGNANVGGSISKTFTIQNTGTVNLSVSSITSSNGLFTVSALSPASPIAAGGSASFSITFSPTTAGSQTSTIIINNDDCNESVYNFEISGSACSEVAWYLDVDNDGYYIATQVSCTSPGVGWHIAPVNGPGDCNDNSNLIYPGITRSCYSGPSGTAGVGVCHAGTQTCQTNSSWGPCNGEVFPTAEVCNGLDDDCDGQVDEGIIGAEINLQGNGVNILDGDVTPALTDHTNFENVLVGNNFVRTYTIQNTGTIDLNVSGITSNNSTFAVSALSPASPIPSGNSATFTVTFT
ncbi:MAG TPA: choice-of-anchor D domain-containing protein, partial [Chitinophagaceae bacterium]|nr:choice-of-anchor D domain-containing protein [Chitinophagaceae bacterium]